MSTEATEIKPYQSTLKGHIETLEQEICPAIMAEFVQVPQFVQALMTATPTGIPSQFSWRPNPSCGQRTSVETTMPPPLS